MDLIAPKSRRSLWAIRAIYLRLLAEIERSNFSVLSRRISVSKARKIGLLFASFLPK
jgi:phytoene/squalene synthetase